MTAHASPLIRCGLPVDVVYAVCFLASKEGEWINGKKIRLDGGAASFLYLVSASYESSK